PERRSVQINRVILETVELLAYSMRVDNVDVHTDLAPDCPALWADPHQLQQVVVNLITNAHQAMRAITGPREIRITSRWEREDGCIAFDVTDTGPGIPPHVRARIFEPFFTT